MVCGNCSATNPEGTNYCGRCGAPLSSAACSSALETESSKADSRVELCWFLHRFAVHTQKAMPAYKAMEKNIRIANRYGAKNYDLQPLAGKYARIKGLIMTIGGAVCAGYFAVTSLKDGALATGQADPIAHAIETAIIGAFYFAPLIYGVFVLFLRQRARKKIKHNKAMVKKYEALAGKTPRRSSQITGRSPRIGQGEVTRSFPSSTLTRLRLKLFSMSLLTETQTA